jgi:hypothetical protein
MNPIVPGLFDLSVRPKSSSAMAEPSHHEADRGEFEEGKRAAVEIFPILGKAAAPIEPGQSALDSPPYNLAKTSFEWSARIDRSELRLRGRNDASRAGLKGRRAADLQGAAKGGADDAAAASLRSHSNGVVRADQARSAVPDRGLRSGGSGSAQIHPKRKARVSAR